MRRNEKESNKIMHLQQTRKRDTMNKNNELTNSIVGRAKSSDPTTAKIDLRIPNNGIGQKVKRYDMLCRIMRFTCCKKQRTTKCNEGRRRYVECFYRPSIEWSSWTKAQREGNSIFPCLFCFFWGWMFFIFFLLSLIIDLSIHQKL